MAALGTTLRALAVSATNSPIIACLSFSNSVANPQKIRHLAAFDIDHCQRVLRHAAVLWSAVTDE
jgi:hypothetical protein